ncbi:MAG: ABC transporter permease subunit [Deltaproteobacteria bacterium]|nr:ABC transporter permease subunit [Deltaproteobacteria bacterium]
MTWWIRPLVRLLAAVALPLAVPALVTGAMWILPGDPAEIICPPGICTGKEVLAERWGLDRGPAGFYATWMAHALSGDFGNSWRVAQGMNVSELVAESLPATLQVVGIALLPLVLGMVGAVLGFVPRRADPIWQFMGLFPSVILALAGAAYIQINYGALSYDGLPGFLRVLFAALVLGLADGALADAIVGTRGIFDEEYKQRYAQVAILRGESMLGNALPNVLPALIGQLRARIVHVVSGTVVVEVVLGVPGLGELLWAGTLLQDFAVVLAAAWAYSLLSGALLLTQGLAEIAVAVWVRSAPLVEAA